MLFIKENFLPLPGKGVLDCHPLISIYWPLNFLPYSPFKFFGKGRVFPYQTEGLTAWNAAVMFLLLPLRN